MKLASRARSWAKSVLRRDRLELGMNEEMRFHLDAYVADLVRSGVPEPEAQRRARVEFGSMDARKAECREALGLRLVDEVRGDLRYSLRQLRRSPGFTLVAVISLALGIGANAAIFSLMEAALWSSIPARSPEQLRLFSWVSGPDRLMNGINGNFTTTAGGSLTSTSFSHPVFVELRGQNQLFESVFAFKPTGRVATVIDGSAELLNGYLVSGNFYQGVGVQPAVGRSIEVADERASAEAAAVISDGFWARRFGRDPAVIGKGLTVAGAPVTIVGVNPPEFTGVEPGASPEIFLPLRLQPIVRPGPGEDPSWLDNPDVWWLLVMGRLRPGTSDAQAEAALDITLQRVVRDSLPDRADRDRPRMALLSGARGLDNLTDFSTPLLVLLSLALVVLLLACANVASLLLARAARRQREISLRLALGAGRWRVARQLFTEGFFLASIAGACGMAVGYGLRDSIPVLLATAWRPGPFQAEFNWRVVGLAVLATTATGVLFSLVPAWRSARTEINAALKDAGRGGGGASQWWRGKPLVAGQISLSILLLISAGLFVRTLWNLASVDLGFQPDRVLLFSLDPSRSRYPDEQRNVVLDRLHEAIRATPGVERATLATEALVARSSGTTRVDTDIANTNPQLRAWVHIVGYDYFETMGIPVLHGRSFNRSDRATSHPVAVVNQQFVQEFFPGGNPIGNVFRHGSRIVQVVGVVGDARYDRLNRPFPPTFYRLYLQQPSRSLGVMTAAVRTATDDASVVPAIRKAVRSIDVDLPVFDVRTQHEQIAATVSQERLFVTLTSVFALLAVTLVAIGVYGILAHAVAQRTNEIGIRLALGARRGRVQWMILREAAVVAVIGTVAGVVAAIGLSRYVESLLFGVEPIDGPTIGAAVLLMIAVALLAGWLPARRASRMEPMVALRHE